MRHLGAMIICVTIVGAWSMHLFGTDVDSILLSRGNVAIPFDEAFFYSVRHTNPDAYKESISKPQATYRVLQNLYMLKRAAQLAEENSLVRASEQAYLVDDIYRRTLLERYLEQVVSERITKIDWEGLAAAEYALRKQQFISPEEIRVEHLLVSIDGIDFDMFVEKVREVERHIASNDNFIDLIERYSDDPSARQNKGDLGFFGRQRMQPTFSQAAFSLAEPGEITGPVMTRFGAHFIRLVDRRAETQLTFNEVKRSLVSEVKESMRSELREEFLSELRNEIEPDLATIDEQDLVQRFIDAYEERGLHVYPR